MFCPNCGANNSTEQKFCRSCGLNLEQTSISLLEQLPNAQAANLTARERRLEKFGAIAFGGFGIVIGISVLGIIYAILTGMILSGKQPWFGVLLILFIVFGLLTVSYIIFSEDLKDRKNKLKSNASHAELPSADTGKLLQESFVEPVPSVTEVSTELLTVKKNTRSLE